MRRSFETILDKLELMAEECVFIDDIAVNVEAADGQLMRAIQYVNHEQLCADLKKMGVHC
jgi:FMN phosphatase YigB (HAD superfamily)